jgi:hypothetical protein
MCDIYFGLHTRYLSTSQIQSRRLSEFLSLGEIEGGRDYFTPYVCVCQDKTTSDDPSKAFVCIERNEAKRQKFSEFIAQERVKGLVLFRNLA